MSRPYPNRRRKRPGRRPPHRYRGGAPPPHPRSFQDFGLRHAYDLIFPDIRGRDRRRFFNKASVGIVAGVGLSGALVGSSESRLLVAILGGIAAAAFVGHALKKHQLHRP